jgi:hypothetical protein
MLIGLQRVYLGAEGAAVGGPPPLWTAVTFPRCPAGTFPAPSSLRAGCMHRLLLWARSAWRPRRACFGLSLAPVLCMLLFVILLVLSRAQCHLLGSDLIGFSVRIPVCLAICSGACETTPATSQSLYDVQPAIHYTNLNQCLFSSSLISVTFLDPSFICQSLSCTSGDISSIMWYT